MRPTRPAVTLLMLGVIAVFAGTILCAFDADDISTEFHGCLPPVVTAVSALAAMPFLTRSGAAVLAVPDPKRSIFLDTSTPPPKPSRRPA